MTGQESFDIGLKAYLDLRFDEALRELTRSVEAGHWEGLFFLALMHAEGEGVPADLTRAQELFIQYFVRLRQEASSGNPEAQFTLGRKLQFGDRVLQNESEATYWFEKSAAAGNAEAQYHLSCLYLHGWCGLRKDDERADYWLGKAVGAHHPEALYSRGVQLWAEYEHTQEASYLAQARHFLSEAAYRGFEEARDLLSRIGELPKS